MTDKTDSGLMGCSCLDVFGENVDCPTHGIETEWSVENRDSGDWQEIATGLERMRSQAQTRITELEAQVERLTEERGLRHSVSVPDAGLRLIEVDKLNKSRAGLTAAYKAGFPLQEKGWARYPVVCWDKPAVLAFAGDECVGGINYDPDDDGLCFEVCFAFCEPKWPSALTLLLLRLRRILRAKPHEEITFTCHPGNDQMMKAVRVLGLSPSSLSFRMPAQGMETR